MAGNEKRLIDAWKLVIDLARIKKCGEWDHEDVMTVIASQKTVDAVEVVRGEWEKQQGIYSCSICGKACPYDVQADIIQYWTCNYCPNCGAKMDEERKDNG